MNENKKIIIEKRIQKTGENLRKNNMEFYYAPQKEDVADIVKELLNDGDVITHGGTVSMTECGLNELISSPARPFEMCARRSCRSLQKSIFRRRLYFKFQRDNRGRRTL